MMMISTTIIPGKMIYRTQSFILLLLLLGSSVIVEVESFNVDSYNSPTTTTMTARRRMRQTSSTTMAVSTCTTTATILYSNDDNNDNSNENPKPFFTETKIASTTSTVTDDNSDSVDSSTTKSTTTTAQFGEVMPLRKPSSETTTAAQFGEVMPLRKPSSSSSSFGEVTPLRKPPSTTKEEVEKVESSTPIFGSLASSNTATAVIDDTVLIQQRRKRNMTVALLSIILALSNYSYQWTHPVTPIQLLFTMEKSSSPVHNIGRNNKPTVIDFWAPWCENCRYSAPTLYQVEELYKDQVNFVMVNADDPKSWPLIEKLGVDAIPHLSLLEADGTVDTALIGPVPKQWLIQDIDVLLNNAATTASTTTTATTDAATATTTTTSRQPLPHQMLDVFANKPSEQRKILIDMEVSD